MFLTMPEQRAIDKSFDIRSFHPFEDIRHVACLHAVDSIDSRDAIDARGAELLDVDEDPMQDGFWWRAIHHFCSSSLVAEMRCAAYCAPEPRFGRETCEDRSLHGQ
jgi:hypothetical protein